MDNQDPETTMELDPETMARDRVDEEKSRGWICEIFMGTPAFAEEILGGENVDGEAVPPPERSFWAKYWMYLIPLGLIVMNAMTQAMNMPEEQASGQPGSQTQQTGAAVQRGQTASARRG
ncbi:hypothetical protein Acr_24g0007430 [Actinidia rufa]|uniref:ER membrane protein complex subunit 10 n=1 Tax=Actinidia rufa TaxID=165716 RepID=A0A7J0GUT7_9ERIC|nr:hypothetical protein Acr_24g0007430 [Actinidia rufa]